jgi:endonuclease YncB( thermonuclease family)
MPFRETLLNLAITAVLVLIVVLAGILLKESRPRTAPAGLAQRPAPADAPAVAQAPAVTAEFEVFPRPVLIESRANEADTLRIQIRGEEHIFVLYFVDALEATMNHPQIVAAQGRFFHNASDKVITDTGAEAAAYAAGLLKQHPFHVMTRWEPVANTGRYYAIILVETAPGRREYLADLLMKNGYARRGSITVDLPGGKPSIPEYLEHLKQLGQEAERERRGIWAKVAAPAPLPAP